MLPPRDISLPAPGSRIADKYTIVRTLGEGGMGVVFEARHDRLGQHVALKMLGARATREGESGEHFARAVARFEREARAAAGLRSRHVVRVLDVDDTSAGLPFMVMELLVGRNLQRELEARGPLPVDEAVRFVRQACAAMAEAHDQGIIHRDLKPSNLFVCIEDGLPVLKVLDFGISKVATDGDVSLTATEGTVGTLLYMSPEQLRSARNVDTRTDVWSLGIILYELLVGRAPWVGSPTAVVAAITSDVPRPLRELRPDVPPALAAAVHRAIEKDLSARFPNVRAFAAALSPFDVQGVTAVVSDPTPAPLSPLATTGLHEGAVTPQPGGGRLAGAASSAAGGTGGTGAPMLVTSIDPSVRSHSKSPLFRAILVAIVLLGVGSVIALFMVRGHAVRVAAAPSSAGTTPAAPSTEASVGTQAAVSATVSTAPAAPSSVESLAPPSSAPSRAWTRRGGVPRGLTGTSAVASSSPPISNPPPPASTNPTRL
jgi:serine/threonine-protein kinase